MTSSICVINPVQDSTWDLFVAQHNKGTIFHTSAWAAVIMRTYGYQPHYIVVKDDRKKVTAGMPFFLIKTLLSASRLVCLPFTDRCSPLVDLGNYYENIFGYLLNLVKEGKVSTIEIRAGIDETLSSSQFAALDYYNFFNLELTSDLNDLWSRLKQKSIRYPIRKAQNAGIVIEKSTAETAVRTFCRLNAYTRKKHGVIPQPDRFFLYIQQEIFNRNLGFLLIAWYKNRPIAASIFFVYKDAIYHKFNASDSRYLRYQPNHLILWEAIQWAAANGYKNLDLGRTSPDNRGLMAFKRHWAAQEVSLPYYYWPELRGAAAIKESSLKYRILSTALRKTPLPLLKIAGNVLYGYFG